MVSCFRCYSGDARPAARGVRVGVRRTGLRVEAGDDFCVQLGGGAGDDRVGTHRIAALPVGDGATGAADDGDEGSDIPRVHDRVAHDIGPAGGEEQVAVTVAPGAGEARTRGGTGEGWAVLVSGGCQPIGGEQCALGEGAGGPAAHRLAVERGGATIAQEELPENGLVDGAQHGLAMVEKGDEGAEKRAGSGEALSPVNRIQHPDELGVGTIVAELFADDAVVRKAPGDHRAEELLGPAVGGSDGSLVGLDFHGEALLAKEGADQLCAGFGEFDHEGAWGGEIHASTFGPGGRATKPNARDALADCFGSRAAWRSCFLP